MSEFLLDAQEYRDSVLTSGAITFPRARLRTAAALVAALALDGCAPPRPPVVLQQTAVAPVGPAYAIVVAVRQIPGSGAAASDPQTAILDAMGLIQTAANGASSEIVVRTDDGHAISVVRSSAADPASNLRVGERVRVVPGGLLRLAPAVPQG